MRLEKIDILNRGQFIEQLVNLVQNIPDNRSSVTFAIDGKWGCGKTFVLDMFEEKLSEIQSEKTATDKYLVIRYNCWKYDYYEEPLVAIVAAVMDIIEKNSVSLFNSQEKHELLGMLQATGDSLLSMFLEVIKIKTGIDFQQARETIKKGKKEGINAYENEHKYDAYFSFNQILGDFSKLLRKIAQEYIIVFLVDELDRCLPEYAIKVLERLHHLTEGTTNVITIISIDKERLTSSIKQIFGFDDIEKYLRKFIQFTVPLDTGVISERINDKFSEYIELFDMEIFPVEDSIEEFMQVVFKGIDIREQERLVNKAMTAHKLLYSDQKDFSFMCVELLMVILSPRDINESKFCPWFSKFYQIRKEKEIQNEFSKFFQNKFVSVQITPIEHKGSFISPKEYRFETINSLYGAIAYIWCKIFFSKDAGMFSLPNNLTTKQLIENNIKELESFWETVKFIK